MHVADTADLLRLLSPSYPYATPVKIRERLVYIQAMRAIAIFIVVTTHCRDPFNPATLIRSDEAGVFFRHINIIFIYISGFLFQFLLKDFNYRGYLRQKGRNVILPYLICSMPAVMTYLVGIKSPASIGAPLWVDSTTKLIVYMLVTGTHMAPFWFIPMMALVYLVSPALVGLDRIRWGYGAIGPLLLIAVMVGRSPGDSSPAHNFLFYLPVYVIGMATSHHRASLMPYLSRCFPILIACIALPLIDISADRWLDNVEFITKIAFCLGLTGMFAQFSGSLPGWVDYIGTISFGVYFIHYYAVAALTIASKSILSGFFARGLAAYGLVVITVLGASIVGVMILKAVFGRYSRLIIGA